MECFGIMLMVDKLYSCPSEFDLKNRHVIFDNYMRKHAVRLEALFTSATEGKLVQESIPSQR